MLIRADLLIHIEKVAKARRLTNQALARVLSVGRRRVDDLRHVRLRRFGTDALIDVLARLGVDVRLVAKSTSRRTLPTKSARSKALGRLRRLRHPLSQGFAFNREEANEVHWDNLFGDTAGIAPFDRLPRRARLLKCGSLLLRGCASGPSH